jgi:penicillin-binding protein 1C
VRPTRELPTPNAPPAYRRIATQCTIALLLAWGLLEVLIKWTSLPLSLHNPPAAPVEFVDRNGTPLRTTPAPHASPSPLQSLPNTLRDAILAAEDKRFLQHQGVDPQRALRALWDNARERRIVSGASTISQQLIKIALLQEEPDFGTRAGRSLSRKIHRVLAAKKLERQWPKSRILSEYASRVELGNLTRGFAAASQFYFDKSVESLDTADAALLAGLIQAPGRLNPLKNPQGALARRNEIISRLHREDWITTEEADRARKRPLALSTRGRPFRAPHFVDLLLQRPDTPRSGTIVTSLDLPLQTTAEQIVRKHLSLLASRKVSEAAVVVIDNPTGEVRALVGSGDYHRSPSGMVNYAWTPRSPGSALKPFTYLLALNHEVSPGSVLEDIPSTFNTPEGPYEPDNYSQYFSGPVLMRRALASSLNVPAVRLLDRIGGPRPLASMLTDFGISTLTKSPAHYGLGLTLGNPEVRLLELTNAYAALARLEHFAPFRLTPANTTIPMGASRSAWLIADMLSDNLARASTFGLKSPLRFEFPVACKTGTSTSFRDNWAIAYTPSFTVGVWAGNPDGSEMQGVSGVTGAGPILHDIVQQLALRKPPTWYPTRMDLVEHRIDPCLGTLSTKTDAIREWFPVETPPPPENPRQRTSDGRRILSPVFYPWLKSRPHDTRFHAEPPDGLRVLSPQEGRIFLVDDTFPSSRWIPLQSECKNPVTWHSETLQIKGDTSYLATGTPGVHSVTATDSVTQETVVTSFEIRLHQASLTPPREPKRRPFSSRAP